ncbi:MAG: response regulator [Cyanobacteria bacterium J06627_28]
MLRLAIANDTAIAVEALRRAIATNPDYQLLWIASTGREAIEHCKTHWPDVLRMDLNMPNLIGTSAGGPHALQKILSQLPSASDTHAVAPAIVMARRCRKFEKLRCFWYAQSGDCARCGNSNFAIASNRILFVENFSLIGFRLLGG